jgi:fructokinase
VVSGEDEVSVPGREVKVVDTVGAGDSFSAGIIYGMLSDWDLEATARVANELAARVAGRPGAMPDLGEELHALKSEFSPQK